MKKDPGLREDGKNVALIAGAAAVAVLVTIGVGVANAK